MVTLVYTGETLRPSDPPLRRWAGPTLEPQATFEVPERFVEALLRLPLVERAPVAPEE